MQATMQALESFRRARMLDAVTGDDDKVAPIYKLDEICELAQSSTSDIIKDMVDYIVKNRLESKSPYVKQKALRLIKYAVPKAGKEFRREIQRHSATIRAFFHYKGTPDPLKGDALNKAVRDMAHEAMQAIFNQEEAKPAAQESSGRRMQAFGNTSDRAPPTDDWRSVGSANVSNLVGLGSESFKQGLNLIREAAGQVGSNSAPSRGKGLHKSLTSGGGSNDDGYESRYEGPRETYSDSERRGSRDSRYRSSRDTDYSDRLGSGSEAGSGTGLGSYRTDHEGSADKSPWQAKGVTAGQSNGKSVPQNEEERLVDGITQPGGVRAQPSREALHAFMNNASQLDGLALGAALENKLRAQVWQVRLKAACVLEAILRNEGDPSCDTVFRFFQEDASVVIDCLESPQASLREKSKRVLELLGLGENHPVQLKDAAAEGGGSTPTPALVEVPDLLDISEPDLMSQLDSSEGATPATFSDPPAGSAAADFLGGDLLGGMEASAAPSAAAPASGSDALGLGGPGSGTDPFAGMSLHHPSASEGPPSGGLEADLFSGLQVNNSSSHSGQRGAMAADVGGLLDSGGPGSSGGGGGLFEGLSLSDSATQSKPADPLAGILGAYASGQPGINQLGAMDQSGQMGQRGGMGMGIGPAGGMQLPAMPGLQGLTLQQQQQLLLQQQLMYMQAMGMGMRPMAGTVGMPGMPNQQGLGGLGFSQPVFGQQGFGGGLGGFPGPGMGMGIGSQSPSSLGGGLGTGPSNGGFDFCGDPTLRHQPTPEAKKEETKAFDFISDHIKSAAVGPKKGSAMNF